MSGGLIQLVAYGVQDLFITHDPQITFFKLVYRRHTNFSIEPVPQLFTHTPNFGKKVSCVVTRSGDLVGQIHLVITLPKIPQVMTVTGAVDNVTKFAWIKRIGYGIIKEIEIEIGGQSIDKHYGEWLNIWSELIGPKDDQIQKIIGNVPELIQFSSEKNEYKLFIPLQFWFCRSNGLALPILCLQYSDVKINLELSDVTKCYIVSPTHSIDMDSDIVNLTPYEYIEQNVNGTLAYGIFSHFDMIEKKLYYTKISKNKFLAINDPSFYNYNKEKQRNILSTYAIKGQTSKFEAYVKINTSSTTTVVSTAYPYNLPKAISVSECFLLVNYIFLDEDERLKFYKSNHQYVIDQLIYVGESSLDGTNRSVQMGLNHPCKLIVWVTQMSFLLDKNVNDLFNYTDSYMYTSDGKFKGFNLVKYATIQFNGHDRMSQQSGLYYNSVHPYQYFAYNPYEGINIYSLSLLPSKLQPSGSCNMSKIDNIKINLQLSSIITTNNPAKFRGYGVVMNVLRIVSGLGGLMFT